jgi:hypothetical protein
MKIMVYCTIKLLKLVESEENCNAMQRDRL